MSGLTGCTEPRLSTEPLRRLTRKTSRGFEVADFAEHVIGEPLLPWQKELVVRGMEITPDDSYRYRTILCLVARQNGKSHLLRVLTLYRLYVEGIRFALGVGQDVSLAREMWSSCIETIKSVPELAMELDVVRRTNGDEWFRLASGGRYKIAAANRSAARGLSVDHLVIDEVREQRGWDAWSALAATTRARPHAQTWCLSNAGDDQSVVLNHLRDAALSGADPSIGLFEWSAPDGCDLDDPRAWQAANPALGVTISEVALRSAMASDPPSVFRTESLCMRVEQLDGAVDLGAWKACADPSGSLESSRDRVMLALDIAPDGQHATLCGAAVLPDGRVRTEVLEAWDSASAVRFALPGIVERVRPAAVAWLPGGPAGALAADLRGLPVEVVEVKGGDVAQACAGFAELVTARRVLHPSDPLLDAHVAGASKLWQGDSFRFARRGVGHCDALYAAAAAIHVARTLPEPARVPRSKVF